MHLALSQCIYHVVGVHACDTQTCEMVYLQKAWSAMAYHYHYAARTRGELQPLAKIMNDRQNEFIRPSFCCTTLKMKVHLFRCRWRDVFEKRWKIERDTSAYLLRAIGDKVAARCDTGDDRWMGIIPINMHLTVLRRKCENSYSLLSFFFLLSFHQPKVTNAPTDFTIELGSLVHCEMNNCLFSLHYYSFLSR